MFSLAIDVNKSSLVRDFQHGEGQTYAHLENPLAASYTQALEKSKTEKQMFRAFPALPDERMKAQEGFFIGSSLPLHHQAPGVVGFNTIGIAPGEEKLESFWRQRRDREASQRSLLCDRDPCSGQGQDSRPAQTHLQPPTTSIFPDVDGFREGFVRGSSTSGGALLNLGLQFLRLEHVLVRMQLR